MKHNKLKRAYRLTEAAFLLALGIYWVYITQFTTMFSLPLFFSPETNIYFRYLYTLLVLSALKIALLILSDADQRLRWLRLLLCAFPVSFIWISVFQKNIWDPYLAVIAILTVGCIGTDYRKILKVYVCAVGSVVFAAAIASFGGVISNLVYCLVYWSHQTVRSSWGIIFPTDMAAYYLYLCIAAWMAWDRISDVWMAVPALFGLFVSHTIADSTTGVICFCLFFLILLWFTLRKRKESSRLVSSVQKAVDFFSGTAFPLFAILMILLMLAYHAKMPLAVKLNAWNHNRLSLAANAYEKYGIHPFGTAFTLIGAGASTYSFKGYNFIDCSYLQILLRYGWILLMMLAVLWPAVSYKAVREDRRRVSVGLALLAFQAISEQRFIELSYNIFLILPFSVLSTGCIVDQQAEVPMLSGEGKRKSAFAAVSTLITGFFAAVLFGRQFLEWLCTICTIIRIPDTKLLDYQRLIFFFAAILLFAFLTVVLYLFYQVFLSLFRRKMPHIRILTALLVCILVFSCVLFRGSRRINNAEGEYKALLKEDQAFLDLAQETDGPPVYVTDLPVLYRKAYGNSINFGSSFYTGEDLARLSGAAVLVDSKLNSIVFLQKGFWYTEISDHHAVYTDSPALVESLSLSGYQPTPYYSKELFVDLEALAEMNRLTLLEDGGLLLPQNASTCGPYLNLRTADYNLRFTLKLENDTALQTADAEDIVLNLKICTYTGENTVLEQNVLRKEFDDTGQLELEIAAHIPEAQNVEFVFTPQNGEKIELRSGSYQIIQ